jgi:hypothetical protein
MNVSFGMMVIYERRKHLIKESRTKEKETSWDLFHFIFFPFFFITKVFKCLEVYKRDLDPLNVTLLHLYFQNYIIMEKMESIVNGKDPNSKETFVKKVSLYIEKKI